MTWIFFCLNLSCLLYSFKKSLLLESAFQVNRIAMSPQHLSSPILTFATKKLSAVANGQKEGAASTWSSFFCRRSFDRAVMALRPCGAAEPLSGDSLNIWSRGMAISHGPLSAAASGDWTTGTTAGRPPRPPGQHGSPAWPTRLFWLRLGPQLRLSLHLDIRTIRNNIRKQW